MVGCIYVVSESSSQQYTAATCEEDREGNTSKVVTVY